MIFGRKKRNQSTDEIIAAQDDEALEDTDTKSAPARADEWEALDNSRDWRQDGPFDISEVDLDADEIERLDFGALVVTPFQGWRLSGRVNQQTGELMSLVISDGKSQLVVTAIAAPFSSQMRPLARKQIISAANAQNATVDLAPGPFGTEIRQATPLRGSDGKPTNRIFQSRIWMVEGPGWLLQGVLNGRAAMVNGIEGPAELLYECFANMVVRRDDKPRVPGSVIELRPPEGMSKTSA